MKKELYVVYEIRFFHIVITSKILVSKKKMSLIVLKLNFLVSF